MDDPVEVRLNEDLFVFGHAQQQGAATDYAGSRTDVDAPGSPQIKNPAGSLWVSQPFTVSRDAVLPQMITVTVPSAAGIRFIVAFSATDAGAGLRGYNVQYQSQGQVGWTAWLTGTSQPQAGFVGTPGRMKAEG